MEETQPTFNPETGVMTFPPGYRFPSNSRKGQHNSPEHNARISASNKIAYQNPALKEMTSKRSKMLFETTDLRQRVSKAQKGRKRTPEQIAAWKIRMDKWIEEHGYPHTGYKLNEEQLQRLSESHKGKPLNEAQLASLEKAHKAALAQLKPTNPEQKLEALLNYYCPKQYRYTGDGSFAIGNLHPDFTNCDGQKKVIEVYGDYWHRGENPQDRISAFAKLNYNCLVIWEHELKVITWNREVNIADLAPLVNKILEFNKA